MRWAQRKGYVCLKFDIDGALDVIQKVEEKQMTLSATGSNNRSYEIELEFFDEVTPEVFFSFIYKTAHFPGILMFLSP